MHRGMRNEGLRKQNAGCRIKISGQQDSPIKPLFQEKIR